MQKQITFNFDSSMMNANIDKIKGLLKCHTKNIDSTSTKNNHIGPILKSPKSVKNMKSLIKEASPKHNFKKFSKTKNNKQGSCKSPALKNNCTHFCTQFETPQNCFMPKNLSPKASIHSLKLIDNKQLSSKQKLRIQRSPKIRLTSPFIFGSPKAQKTKDLKQKNMKASLANAIKIYHPNPTQVYGQKVTQRSSTRQMSKQLASCMSSNNLSNKYATKNDFKYIQVIGEGGYGQVWKVKHLKKGKLYALKQMSKAVILMKKGIQNVQNELNILEKIESQFIANMVCAFNDRENLYLIMDLLPGGDLRSLYGEMSKFTEKQAKFLVACIVQALQYIHENKIVHRDLKPQNLVIDAKGYVRVTDFGVARWVTQAGLKDSSGTPGYMAPQVLCKKGHSFQADFYAVGVILYQLMLRKRPCRGLNRQQIRQQILAKQQSIRKYEVPNDWSLQAADFVNKLIIRNPINRLGSKHGVKQLKNHCWFNKFNWTSLKSKQMESPFKKKARQLVKLEKVDYDQGVLMQYQLLQRAEQKVDSFSQTYYSKFRQK